MKRPPENCSPFDQGPRTIPQTRPSINQCMIPVVISVAAPRRDPAESPPLCGARLRQLAGNGRRAIGISRTHPQSNISLGPGGERRAFTRLPPGNDSHPSPADRLSLSLSSPPATRQPPLPAPDGKHAVSPLMTLLEVPWLRLFALFVSTHAESEGVVFNLAPGGNFPGRSLRRALRARLV